MCLDEERTFEELDCYYSAAYYIQEHINGSGAQKVMAEKLKTFYGCGGVTILT